MKKIAFILICLSFNGVFAQQAEVRKAIDVFFEGFHDRDTIKMKSAMADKMILQSIDESATGNKVITEVVSDFLKSMATIPKSVKFEERLLSYDIKVDGAMATVWAPYELYINGLLNYRGVDSFQLFHDGSTWKIIYLVDTRRK